MGGAREYLSELSVRKMSITIDVFGAERKSNLDSILSVTFRKLCRKLYKACISGVC